LFSRGNLRERGRGRRPLGNDVAETRTQRCESDLARLSPKERRRGISSTFKRKNVFRETSCELILQNGAEEAKRLKKVSEGETSFVREGRTRKRREAAEDARPFKAKGEAARRKISREKGGNEHATLKRTRTSSKKTARRKEALSLSKRNRGGERRHFVSEKYSRSQKKKKDRQLPWRGQKKSPPPTYKKKKRKKKNPESDR